MIFIDLLFNEALYIRTSITAAIVIQCDEKFVMTAIIIVCDNLLNIWMTFARDHHFNGSSD